MGNAHQECGGETHLIQIGDTGPWGAGLDEEDDHPTHNQRPGDRVRVEQMGLDPRVEEESDDGCRTEGDEQADQEPEVSVCSDRTRQGRAPDLTTGYGASGGRRVGAMSKSVTGRDVEDMLSSVRRLVSSELPRNRRTNLPEGPGALVLTDAQRIEPSMIGHNSQRTSLEDRIAELEAAVSQSADDWEPDGSEDQDQHRPDRIVYKSSMEERQSDRPRTLRLSEIALIETGPANDDEAEASDPPVAATTFRHDADDGEILLREKEDHPENVSAQEDIGLSENPVPFQEKINIEALDAGDDGRDEKIVEPALVETEEPAAQASSELSEEDLKSDAETHDEVIEDIATDEAFEEALADAVAASLPDAAVDEIERNADGISTERVKELYSEPEAAQFDEASIRPLVAALIREELQGELGERITRNVRKLVRQEIQRALTVREME